MNSLCHFYFTESDIMKNFERPGISKFTSIRTLTRISKFTRITKFTRIAKFTRSQHFSEVPEWYEQRAWSTRLAPGFDMVNHDHKPNCFWNTDAMLDTSHTQLVKTPLDTVIGLLLMMFFKLTIILIFFFFSKNHYKTVFQKV